MLSEYGKWRREYGSNSLGREDVKPDGGSVRRQEEAARCARALSPGKQGQWMRCESEGKKKLKLEE